jgi:hypothetical protein
MVEGSAMGVDDTIQVRCTRCKSKFRDKARRVRSGYNRQCPACECLVFFEEGTPNKDIQEALREAERVRKALRAEEAEKIASRPVASAEQADDGIDQPPAMPRGRPDRRLSVAARGPIGRRSH